MFTTSGSATGAVLIQELYQRGFVTAVYYNGFLGLALPGGRILFPKKPWGGGLNYNWLLRRGGNASVELFTENQAQPSAGEQQYSLAAVPWTYARAMAQITGMAQDAMKSNYAGIDVVDSELAGAADDVRDLLSVTFLGSTYGLEVAVDDTAAYAGITRGAVSWFESLVDSTGGAVTIAALQDLIEGLRDNDRGANPQAWLMPWNQGTNLYNLAGAPAVQYVSDSDKMPAFHAGNMGGIPMFGVGDMTDTVIACLDLGTPDRPKFLVPVIRPMRVKEMAPSGDSDIFQISTGGAFICEDPLRQGKLTGLAA